MLTGTSGVRLLRVFWRAAPWGRGVQAIARSGWFFYLGAERTPLRCWQRTAPQVFFAQVNKQLTERSAPLLSNCCESAQSRRDQWRQPPGKVLVLPGVCCWMGSPHMLYSLDPLRTHRRKTQKFDSHPVSDKLVRCESQQCESQLPRGVFFINVELKVACGVCEKEEIDGLLTSSYSKILESGLTLAMSSEVGFLGLLETRVSL